MANKLIQMKDKDGNNIYPIAYINNIYTTPSDINIKISNVLNQWYPVGSIYSSLNNINPGNFLGGIWTQLKDRFLFSSSSSHSVGEVGGSATATLTEAQLPEHTHGIGRQNTSPTSGSVGSVHSNGITGARVGIETKSAGNGASPSHNNMPPYLVVYMWERIS